MTSRRNSKTKVTHIITGLEFGGAEMMLWKLLSASNGTWDSIVVSLGERGPLTGRIEELGVPVHCLGLSESVPNPFCLVSCIGLLRRVRPHIIQGWMTHGNLAASCLQSLSGLSARVAWNIRMSLDGIRNEKPSTRAVIRLGAALSWHPAAIVYNSRIGAQQHEAFGYRPARRAVIPNGFDCEVFRPNELARKEVRAQFSLDQQSILVGLVGRYHPMKDHANFVRAASLLAPTDPRVYFVLVGNGLTKDQSNLTALIRKMNLEARFILLGETSDICRITAAFDIACSASTSEGFSNTLGEAMACGVPCVATNVGDTQLLIADSGIVVPPRDPEAMAHAMCELIHRGPVRRKELGLAARKRIESEFSLPQVARRYEMLYEECLATPQTFGQSDLD